jgi:hypothetical protein
VANPANDHLGHTLGNPEPLECGLGDRLLERDVGFDQGAERLLDEEGVALGLLAQPPDEARSDPRPHAVGDQGAGAGLVESSEHEAVVAALATKVGQEVDERVVPGDLDVAERADDQQVPELLVAEQVAEEKQSRLVGPVQVVQHEQERPFPACAGQQGDDRLEEPVAQRLLVDGRGHRLGGRTKVR